jgi:hypothetical protein
MNFSKMCELEENLKSKNTFSRLPQPQGACWIMYIQTTNCSGVQRYKFNGNKNVEDDRRNSRVFIFGVKNDRDIIFGKTRETS